MTIAKLLQVGTDKLAPDPLARLEAEILLGHTLEVNRSFLFANPELEPPLKRRNQFLDLLRKRSQGVPIAYLTGKKSFWTLELEVTPDVLIPRPETESLVELALKLIPRQTSWRIADLGTGSGAIALSIASERPSCEVHASDISEPALSLARSNARNHQLKNVSFHLGSWFEPLCGQFQLIVSNPPYVDEQDPHLQQGDCRFEPKLALSPGADGLSSIREISENSRQHLVPGGWLLMEHGFDQGAAVRQLLQELGYQQVSTEKDLAGLERISHGAWQPEQL